IDEVRRRQRTDRVYPLARPAAPDPENVALTSALTATAEDHIAKLSEEQQAVIWLWRLGFDFQTTGEILGKSRDAVYMISKRALERLRDEMQDDDKGGTA